MSAEEPRYRSEFMERYRLWKGLERLATTCRIGAEGINLDTIAGEEGTRAEWLNPETALDLLASDLQRGEIQVKHLEHNARRLGLDPSDVRAELARRTVADDEAREAKRSERAAELFAGSVLAFDPGDATGWALLRLDSGAERCPVILSAGAFRVDIPSGEGFISGADDAGAMRKLMTEATARGLFDTMPAPEIPEQSSKHAQRVEPGAAAMALIRKLRPSVVMVEWIYRVFPKGKRVQTSEGPITKSGMSVAMTTGLYRAGVIAGAIRAAALACGVPVVHASAAQCRRAIVGNYRAKNGDVRRTVARIRTEPGILPVKLGSTHARDASVAGLFALSQAPGAHEASLVRPAEAAPSGEAAPVEPTTKRKPGRPRIHPLPDPSAPRRPRGRPRTRPLLDPNEPRRPRGRPRKMSRDAAPAPVSGMEPSEAAPRPGHPPRPAS
jgi:hypothetical protein